MLTVCTFNMMWRKPHFISMVFLSKLKTPGWEKYQRQPNGGNSYSVRDQYSSGPSRSTNAKKVWVTVTAKQSLKKRRLVNHCDVIASVCPRIKCGLVLYQHWFTDCNKCTTLMWDVNNRRNGVRYMEVLYTLQVFLKSKKVPLSKICI